MNNFIRLTEKGNSVLVNAEDIIAVTEHSCRMPNQKYCVIHLRGGKEINTSESFHTLNKAIGS